MANQVAVLERPTNGRPLDVFLPEDPEFRNMAIKKLQSEDGMIQALAAAGQASPATRKRLKVFAERVLKALGEEGVSKQERKRFRGWAD